MVKKNKINLPVDLGTLFIQGLLVVYLISDFPVSVTMADFGRSPAGLALVGIICLSTFSIMGPVTGVLALLAAYLFLSKSMAQATDSPTIVDKGGIDRILKSADDEENTLEEDIVASMAPPRSLLAKPQAPYVPVLSNQNGLGSSLS